MFSLKLNRKSNSIKARRVNNNIRLGIVRQTLNLRHTGLRGPQGIQGIKGDKGDKGDIGDTGETGISTFVRVHHSSDQNVARPNALYVEWVGSVAPINGTVEDTWIDTA